MARPADATLLLVSALAGSYAAVGRRRQLTWGASARKRRLPCQATRRSSPPTSSRREPSPCTLRPSGCGHGSPSSARAAAASTATTGSRTSSDATSTALEHIEPAWQDPQVGDPFRLHPEVALEVVAVAPGHALVVRGACRRGGPKGRRPTTSAGRSSSRGRDRQPAARPRALPVHATVGARPGRARRRRQLRDDAEDAARHPRARGAHRLSPGVRRWPPGGRSRDRAVWQTPPMVVLVVAVPSSWSARRCVPGPRRPCCRSPSCAPGSWRPRAAAPARALLAIKQQIARPISAIVVLNNIFNIVGSIAVGTIAAGRVRRTVGRGRLRGADVPRDPLRGDHAEDPGRAVRRAGVVGHRSTVRWLTTVMTPLVVVFEDADAAADPR
jgi:hypothetical protein